jgi:phosphoglycerol transferase MdoB-like AlkP superfamily enzyme
MKKLLRSLPPPVQFIVLIYGTGMLIFSSFRILLLCLHVSEAGDIPASVLLKAFLTGVRFDAVINGYLLALPALILFLFSFFKQPFTFPAKFLSVFVTAVYVIAFFIHVVDIRWYGHGASRLTVSVLQWTDTPGWMLKFIFQDIYNYPLLILLFALVFLFYVLIKRFSVFSFGSHPAKVSLLRSISFFLLLFVLMFAGIRGRVAIKSPIRWGTAFFSEYNFANQLGLNPVYTFMRSWLDQKENQYVIYDYMSGQAAEKMLRENFGAADIDTSISPVARKVTSYGNPHRYNVVLVLMESMSAKNMTHFGNSGNLTPVLDSLCDHSISFSHFYSDGNHTFNGIYSSLYGFYSLPMVHHMKDLAHQQPYGGLANTLLSHGYSTTFFTTHDEQFDNMAGFLLPNGFQKIISEKDYERKYVMSTMGVPDHIMFDRAVHEMNALSKNEQPFFAAMITGSNHEPFVLPDMISFKAHSQNMNQKMVEYADWSIGRFLAEASAQTWFDSTIFIFTGDHGGLIDGFDHYLSFHHIPLIIYAPKIFPAPKTILSVGGQADIFATACGALNISYTNNSMGVDLFQSGRSYYPFDYDEEMCCISTDYFFVSGHDRERFYSISGDGKTLKESAKSSQTDSMKVFMEAAMQVTQRMIEGRKMK